MMSEPRNWYNKIHIKLLNTKWKDRQTQLSSHKMNRWQAELATFAPKGGNSITQT